MKNTDGRSPLFFDESKNVKNVKTLIHALCIDSKNCLNSRVLQGYYKNFFKVYAEIKYAQNY